MNFDMYSYLNHSARIIDKNFLHLAKAVKAVDKRCRGLAEAEMILLISQACLLGISAIQDKQITALTAKVKELEEDNLDLNMAIYGAPNNTAEDKDEEM